MLYSATSRLIVQKSIASDFKNMLALKLQNLNFKQSLATNDQFNKVKSYIEKANNLLGEKMIEEKSMRGNSILLPQL